MTSQQREAPSRQAANLPAHGPLAHLVEHLSCKQEARSSSLRWSTGVWASLVCHLIWDQVVAGSNPVTPTGMWRSLVARRVRDAKVLGSNPGIPTHGSLAEMDQRPAENRQRQARYLRDPRGRNTTASVPAFQAGNAGSIPVGRSRGLPPSPCAGSIWPGITSPQARRVPSRGITGPQGRHKRRELYGLQHLTLNEGNGVRASGGAPSGHRTGALVDLQTPVPLTNPSTRNHKEGTHLRR